MFEKKRWIKLLKQNTRSSSNSENCDAAVFLFLFCGHISHLKRQNTVWAKYQLDLIDFSKLQTSLQMNYRWKMYLWSLCSLCCFFFSEESTVQNTIGFVENCDKKFDFELFGGLVSDGQTGPHKFAFEHVGGVLVDLSLNSICQKHCSHHSRCCDFANHKRVP